jgi:translation initiation factor IF-1
MRIVFYISAISLLLACSKEKYFGGPNTFSDDFESYASIDSTLDGDNLYWSFFQRTIDGNGSVIDTIQTHSGNQSIQFFAAASNENEVSKSSISKQKMAFYEGDIVHVEMWYYIEGTASADWLFLFDIEEQAAIGAGPGIRLAMVEDELVVEHKYFNPNIFQTEGSEKKVPRNEWFKITFEAELSQKEKGYIKVWQNDTLIIEQQKWRTLPKDALYFQQGTKGMYSSIEFGLTANSKDNPMIIYLDDVSVKILN